MECNGNAGLQGSRARASATTSPARAPGAWSCPASLSQARPFTGADQLGSRLSLDTRPMSLSPAPAQEAVACLLLKQAFQKGRPEPDVAQCGLPEVAPEPSLPSATPQAHSEAALLREGCRP